MEQWISGIANGGALVLLAFVLWQGGKFGATVARTWLDEWRKSNEAQIGVLREIRDSMHRQDLERERRTHEVLERIETSAKETRHRLRNDLQALAAQLPCPDDDSDPPHPPSPAQHPAPRGRDRDNTDRVRRERTDREKD